MSTDLMLLWTRSGSSRISGAAALGCFVVVVVVVSIICCACFPSRGRPHEGLCLSSALQQSFKHLIGMDTPAHCVLLLCPQLVTVWVVDTAPLARLLQLKGQQLKGSAPRTRTGAPGTRTGERSVKVFCGQTCRCCGSTWPCLKDLGKPLVYREREGKEEIKQINKTKILVARLYLPTSKI